MLMRDADALDFVRQQYRHCKPILAAGAGAELLLKAGLPATLENGAPDLSLWCVKKEELTPALAQFKHALASHRNFQRQVEAVVL
jgi:catalase